MSCALNRGLHIGDGFRRGRGEVEGWVAPFSPPEHASDQPRMSRSSVWGGPSLQGCGPGSSSLGSLRPATSPAKLSRGALRAAVSGQVWVVLCLAPWPPGGEATCRQPFCVGPINASCWARHSDFQPPCSETALTITAEQIRGHFTLQIIRTCAWTVST